VRLRGTNSLILTLPFLSRVQNHKELFNYRHAQLRNIIERTFGVFKRRFKVLINAQEYSLETQARLVSALAVVHNFICIHDPRDVDPTETDIIEDQGSQIQGAIRGREERVAADERGRAAEHRDRIAHAMWRDYRDTGRA
jgi:hypothetical protein